MADDKGCVLLVDDEQEILHTLSACLKKFGFTTHVAMDVEQGEALLAKHACDVLILDQCMPGGDGLAWLSGWTAQQNHPEVIMVTGQATVETALQAMALGVFGFLTKPVPLRQFVTRVTAAVERHRLRQVATDEQDRFQTLVEHLPVGVVETTPEGRVCFCNTRAAGILGYDVDEYKQLQVGELYVESADRNRLTKQLAKAGEHHFEYPLRHREGHTVWVRGSTRVMEREGEVVYLGVFEDITQSRDMAAALARTQSEVASLRARLAQARPDDGQEESVGLQQCVEQEVERQRHKQGMEIEAVVDIDAGEVDAEIEHLVRQVLGQLLEHMRHYVSRVRVEVNKTGGDLVMDVRDNAPGITGGPDESRVARALADVRALLGARGGKLEVSESDAGHLMRVVLPLPDKTAAAASKQRALIVSASAIICQALKSFLTEGHGIQAQTIDTLKQLNDLTWATPWDLIVIDMALTGAESAAVVRRIYQHAPQSRVIVVVEGRPMARVRELMEAGALGCMTARCSKDAWRQAVETVLAGKPYHTAILASESTSDGEAPHQKLSAREFEILCSIGEGLSVQQIAQAADRSEVTIRKARRNLLKKMKMETDAALIHYAARWELIDLG